MAEEIKTAITPSQYFDAVKNAKQHITTEALKESYNVFIKLGEKYKRLGQTASLEKLCFLADTLIKEEKLIEMGITTFVYKDVIEDYISNVADKSVKIIELSRYMREIPDEFVETIENTRNIFNEFYVVFTDYTGKEERKTEKERRDKDPILFGVFKDAPNVADRFYFIGDWVDEYCDLTLDKMIQQYSDKKGYSPANNTTIPTTSEELLEVLKTYRVDTRKDSKYMISLDDNALDVPVSNFRTAADSNPKASFFDKIRNTVKYLKSK